MAYTEEELLEELKNVAEEVEGTPTVSDMDEIGGCSSATYQNRFGSWNNALREAGLSVNRERDSSKFNMEHGEVIAELREISEEYCNGEAPTWRDCEEYCQHDPETYTENFNCSWNDLVKEATGDYNTPGRRRGNSNYTKNELLGEIDRLSEEFHGGGTPLHETLVKEGVYSEGPYKTVFGSWSNALQEAGYEPNVREFSTDEPKEELIEDIQRVSNEGLGGKRPRFKDMLEYGNAPISFYEYFGSWNNAVEAAGFERYEIDSTGEDHFHWSGGYVGHYGPSWYRRRREVKQRDGDVCRVCDTPQHKTLGSLEVHHISPCRYWDVEQEHDQMNHPRNLISLCISCHRELDGMFKGRNHKEFEELAKDYMDVERGLRRSVFEY